MSVSCEDGGTHQREERPCKSHKTYFFSLPCTQEYQILSMHHSQVNQSMHTPQDIDTPLQLHVTKSFMLFLKSSSKSSLKFEIKEGWKGD